MKYHEMTKNYIFREFECGLSIEETANLCFKSVRCIKEWDKGKAIPKECRRLMRMASRHELGYTTDWNNFVLRNNRLEIPTGRLVTPQEIITGIALLEIQSELEITTTTKLLKFARAIAKLIN